MSRGARKEGFSRRHRFSGRGSFSAALRSPRKLRGRVATLHIATGRPGSSRFGLAISKRITPNSVDRCRLKRLAREVFRRHAVKLAGMDLVLIPKGPMRGSDGAAWVREIEELLGRALMGS
jgi:ribonuclease P protein component